MAALTVMETALALLNRQSYSTALLREKLIGKGYGEAETDECLERIRQWGYVNDRQFGSDRIALLKQRLKSRAFVIADLEAKGLPAVLIAELMTAHYAEDVEASIIRQLIRAKTGRNKNNHERIWRSLMQAGFPSETVSRCFSKGSPT